MATAELEFDHSLFGGLGQRGPMPGDDKLFVKFYMHYVEDAEESEKQGRPMYKDTEFVRIITPGDRNNIVDRPVRPEDKTRFAKQYAHYQTNGSEAVVGTVLEQWPLISRAMVENLKGLGFFTVEQLAGARDDVLMRAPGLQTLRDRAKHYLEVAAGNAPITQLEAQLAEQKNYNEVLNNQVKELSDRVAELQKAKK